MFVVASGIAVAEMVKAREAAAAAFVSSRCVVDVCCVKSMYQLWNLAEDSIDPGEAARSTVSDLLTGGRVRAESA